MKLRGGTTGLTVGTSGHSRSSRSLESTQVWTVGEKIEEEKGLLETEWLHGDWTCCKIRRKRRERRREYLFVTDPQ